MPRRKFNRRRRVPRRVRRFRRRGPKSVRISKPIGFPDRTFTVLKYGEMVNTSSAASFNFVIRGNGPYDPNQTGAGHQPYYFDQWCNGSGIPYARYRVHACKIIIRPVEITNEFVIGVHPSIDGVAPSNATQLMELPRSKWAPCVVGANLPVIKHKLKTKTVYGVNTIKDEDNFTGSFGSLPANQWYWVISGWAADGTTNFTTSFAITVFYFMEFYDRTLPGQS